jgi:hypothetical protein
MRSLPYVSSFFLKAQNTRTAAGMRQERLRTNERNISICWLWRNWRLARLWNLGGGAAGATTGRSSHWPRCGFWVFMGGNLASGCKTMGEEGIAGMRALLQNHPRIWTPLSAAALICQNTPDKRAANRWQTEHKQRTSYCGSELRNRNGLVWLDLPSLDATPLPTGRRRNRLRASWHFKQRTDGKLRHKTYCWRIHVRMTRDLTWAGKPDSKTPSTPAAGIWFPGTPGSDSFFISTLFLKALQSISSHIGFIRMVDAMITMVSIVWLWQYTVAKIKCALPVNCPWVYLFYRHFHIKN